MGKPLISKNDVIFAISQSGETADTLEAIRVGKENGALTIGIVNGVGSSIARETDAGIYLHAGPEIGVASTKAFTCQTAVLLMVALHLGQQRGQISPEDFEKYCRDMAASSGSGTEIKHAAVTLVERFLPVVVVAFKSSPLYADLKDSIMDLRERKAAIIVLTDEGNTDFDGIASFVIPCPQTSMVLEPLISVVPLQLLSYHIAQLRGCEIDQPKNLAKSVTVE